MPNHVNTIHRPLGEGSLQEDNLLASFKVALFNHPAIPTNAAILPGGITEPFSTPPAIDVAAWCPRHRDLHRRSADSKDISDTDVRFLQPGDRQVLAKASGRHLIQTGLFTPGGVVLGGIGQNGHLRATMPAAIGHSVAL